MFSTELIPGEDINDSYMSERVGSSVARKRMMNPRISANALRRYERALLAPAPQHGERQDLSQVPKLIALIQLDGEPEQSLLVRKTNGKYLYTRDLQLPFPSVVVVVVRALCSPCLPCSMTNIVHDMSENDVNVHMCTYIIYNIYISSCL